MIYSTTTKPVDEPQLGNFNFFRNIDSYPLVFIDWPYNMLKMQKENSSPLKIYQSLQAACRFWCLNNHSTDPDLGVYIFSLHYAGPILPHQNSRKLEVIDRKLQGAVPHPPQLLK